MRCEGRAGRGSQGDTQNQTTDNQDGALWRLIGVKQNTKF